MRRGFAEFKKTLVGNPIDVETGEEIATRDEQMAEAASQRCTECGKLCMGGEDTITSPSNPYALAHQSCVVAPAKCVHGKFKINCDRCLVSGIRLLK
jgi:hypothetical protein